MGGNSRNITTGISTAVLAIGTGMKAVTKVSEGEMGVRVKRGRARRVLKNGELGELYGVVGPGLKVITPFVHSIYTVDVKDRTHNFQDLPIDCNDEQLAIKSSMIWRVSREGDNPYKARFIGGNDEQLTTTVSGICFAGLGEVAAAATSRAELKNFREIDGNVKSIVARPLLEYGVEMKLLNISSITRTFGEMIRHANMDSAQHIGALAAGSALHHEQSPFQPAIVG